MSKGTFRDSDRLPVCVIGGGVVGLSVGWRLARRGARVIVFDRAEAGRGASWVAAGMLAPLSEVGFEEEDFLALGLDSLERYPRFLEELSRDAGLEIPLDPCGALLTGYDRDDTARLRRLYEFRKSLGLPVRWLSGLEAREIEPLLSPRTVCAIWIPDDCQVNNRALVGALGQALERCKGTLREHCPVLGIRIEAGRVTAVSTEQEEIEAGCVVLAAGCWSKQVSGIPREFLPPVRPVKGQIITLGTDETFGLRHVVRAPDAYLLSKGDGRLLLGASEEEMGFDTSITAGVTYRLLERGWRALPSIYDLPLLGIEVGLRPGSRDHNPIVGESPIEGLYYATGHYRNGILLAPATAEEICSLVLEGRSSAPFAPFRPARFLPAGGGARAGGWAQG